MFDLRIELNGKTVVPSESAEFYEEADFEQAFKDAKVAILRKCDYCGRRVEGICCVEVPLEGPWSLL